MIDPNSIFKPGIYREKPSDAFDEEERRIAKLFLQGDNLERMKRAEEKGRRFRPAPVHVHYEFFEVPGNIYASAQFKIVRVENGRQEPHHWDAFATTMEAEVKRLRGRGFTVRRVYLGDEEPRRPKPESRKKLTLNSLANFKLGRR